jgi:hypothetical protein
MSCVKVDLQLLLRSACEDRRRFAAANFISEKEHEDDVISSLCAFTCRLTAQQIAASLLKGISQLRFDLDSRSRKNEHCCLLTMVRTVL